MAKGSKPSTQQTRRPAEAREASSPQPADRGDRPDRSGARSGMGRRSFLQLGLVGAGAAAGLRQLAASPAAAQTGRPAGDRCAPDLPQNLVAPSLDAPVTPAVPETWNEPWVWRPSDWPGQQLDLNVVENENPGVAVGFGNPGSVLFNYGGQTPGPTIRMKGDEILHVKLRNLLGQDFGTTPVGPYPDTVTLPPGLTPQEVQEKAQRRGQIQEDFCLGEHTNGVHSNRVTNLHTHGLHVRPSRNPNGTHSDNVILRVLSQADFRRREKEEAEASCAFLRKPDEIYFLRDDEQAGQADYEFRLGDVQRERREAMNRKREREGKPPIPPQKHPSGTFWYHPHAHGATHNQVASGMAGFLIVEGDVDEAVNVHLAGEASPDPERKTGPWCYRERLMLIQRVLNQSTDPDADAKELRQDAGNFQALTNGNARPTVIRMRPGAVERWRVLDGSVDGRGYKRFMVVKGQYTVTKATPQQANPSLFEVVPDPNDPDDPEQGTLKPVTVRDLEALEERKQKLHQLSIDGIPLLDTSVSPPRYEVKDLSEQNAGTANPLWSYAPGCAEALGPGVDPATNDAADLLCRLRNVWRTKENVKNAFVRPNEFYMGPANRTDLFFQAPRALGRGDSKTGKYEVYTVLAKAVLLHSDNPEQGAQRKIYNATRPAGEPAQGIPGQPPAEDVVVAWIVVSGDEVERKGDPVAGLTPKLPPVQDYLLPIRDDELRVTPEEVKAKGLSGEPFRTRTVVYSGWGGEDFPLVSTFPGDPSAEAFRRFVASSEGKNLDKLRYAENCRYPDNDSDCNSGRSDPFYALLPANIRSMAIDAGGDKPDPGQPAGRKFDPNDVKRPRMLENTAEEWALYNASETLWGNTTTKRRDPATPTANDDPREEGYEQPPTQFDDHFVSYPLSRREGAEIFDRNRRFQIVTKGVDHPFHIHQNPFWVTRIEIPDENGDLVNVLDEPRWMDVIWIPRNRGRVVMRSRFPDYVGAYVHHCHILLHEDNGMMTVVEATPFADQANYQPRPKVSSPGMSEQELSMLYPRPTPEEGWVRSASFVDPDPKTGQVYPGFQVTAPKLPGGA